MSNCQVGACVCVCVFTVFIQKSVNWKIMLFGLFLASQYCEKYATKVFRTMCWENIFMIKKQNVDGTFSRTFT